MAPKKKKEARARSKSHKKPTPASGATSSAGGGHPSPKTTPPLQPPTAATSPPLPSPHPSARRSRRQPAMLPSSLTKKTDPLLASFPPPCSNVPSPLALLLTLPTQQAHAIPLSSLRDAVPSSSSGETHVQELGSCGYSGESSPPPPPPPDDELSPPPPPPPSDDDDEPFDPSESSVFPRPSDFSVRPDAAEPAELLTTTHVPECAEPSTAAPQPSDDDDEPFDPSPSVFAWPPESLVRPDAAEPAELLTTTHGPECVEPSTAAPPPSDDGDEPFDAKPSGFPWPPESLVRPDAAEPAELLTTTHRPECAVPPTTAAPPRTKRLDPKKKEVRLPTNLEQTVRSLSGKEHLAQLLVPAIAGAMYSATSYDEKKDEKTLAEKLLPPVGLGIHEMATVLESLQELAEKKGEEAEIEAAAKAAQEMESIVRTYGVAAKLVLDEKAKRDVGPSTGSCKEEGSSSSSAGGGSDYEDGGDGDGFRV